MPANTLSIFRFYSAKTRISLNFAGSDYSSGLSTNTNILRSCLGLIFPNQIQMIARFKVKTRVPNPERSCLEHK